MNDYEKIKKDSVALGEKNDCAVRAVTALSNLPYNYVNALFRRNGRRRGRGTPWPIIWKSIKNLNLTCEETKIFTAKTVTSLEKQLPKKGRFLVHVSGHVLAAVNGKVVDWTSGRRHRIKRVWEVGF